jgi:anti-sigma B factor antagonist
MQRSEPTIPLSVHAEHLDGVVRLFAHGELDISTVPLLEEWLEAVQHHQPTTILVDFKDLTFMDSTGLRSLLLAHQQATKKGRVLVVLNGSEGVRKVFELTQTHHLLETNRIPEVLSSTNGRDGEWSPINVLGPDGE